MIKYIDMHTFSAKSNPYKDCSWLINHPHGKNGWGYVVIDTSKNPIAEVGYIDITNYKTDFARDTKRIKVFYINKEYRGLGIVNRLMQLAVDRNAYVVDTSPNPDYELDHVNALHLYDKFGFKCKVESSKRYKKLRYGFRNENHEFKSISDSIIGENGIPYWNEFVHLYRVSIEPKYGIEDSIKER